MVVTMECAGDRIAGAAHADLKGIAVINELCAVLPEEGFLRLGAGGV